MMYSKVYHSDWAQRSKYTLMFKGYRQKVKSCYDELRGICREYRLLLLQLENNYLLRQCGYLLTHVAVDNLIYIVSSVDPMLPPANTIHCTNVGSMLVHRLRRWPNIEPTLVQCILLNQHRYIVSCFQTRFKPNEMLVKLVKYGMVGRCLVNEIIIGFKDVYVSSFAA